MSLVFSASATKSGIVDLIYANTGTDSVKYPIAEVVRDVNLALDKFLSIALPASGKWQFDDSNHTGYPILTANLVSGQRDYPFVLDSAGNMILDIFRVMVADESGRFYDLRPTDQQTKEADTGMVNGQDLTGKPSKYDKTGNGIFLDLIPNYSYANGLKIFINRETTYFTSSDTTKKAGFAGIFHEYLALRPSYQFAYRKGLSNAKALQTEMLIMEEKIEEYYSKRAKDEPTQIIPKYRSPR